MFEGVVSYPKLTDKFVSFSLSQPYVNQKTNVTTWTNMKCMLPASKYSFITEKMRLIVFGRLSQSEYQDKTYYTLWGDYCVVVQKNQPNGQGAGQDNIPFPQSKTGTADVSPVKNDTVIGEEPIPF